MNEMLYLNIWSVADWSVPGRLAAVGAIIDALPSDWHPNRWGPTDPARHKVDTNVEDVLDAWAPKFVTGKHDYLDLRSVRTKADMSIELRASPGWCGLDLPSGSTEGWHSYFTLSLDLPWIEADPNRLAIAAQLFRDLCGALDAFYGYTIHTEAERWRIDLAGAAADRGELVLGTLDSDEPLGWDSVFLPDVFWLNFFGPAFVARWGRDRLAAVGPHEWASNGGIVIRATEELVQPFPARIGEPGWKRPFYDLDPDAFIHEGMTRGAPGEHVPTTVEHRAHCIDSPPLDL